MSGQDARIEAAAKALLGPSWRGTPEQHAAAPKAWENALYQAREVLAAADAAAAGGDHLIAVMHEAWAEASRIVLNDADAQDRQQRTVDLLTGGLIDAGVLSVESREER